MHSLKLKEEDKLKIVEDYLHWLDKARKENILINGKEIKGRTREILAERFNISYSTAKRIIGKIKSLGSNDPKNKKEKSTNEKVVDVIKKLDKINDTVSDMIDELNETQIN